MKSNNSGLLNPIKPIKMSHSNSFILRRGDHSNTFNKTNEKIAMYKFDLETTKDTIIKLRSEIMNKNKEINDLKFNKIDKGNEHLYTLKVIETVLQILNEESPKEEKNETENKNNNNNNYKADTTNNNNNNTKVNAVETENKNESKEENKKFEKDNKTEKDISSTNNKLPPISMRTEKSPTRRTNKTNKEVGYIMSLKQQINTLKGLLNKKEEEIKEMQKNKTPLNFSKLQNNLEKNFTELANIKKQNEFMKTKIEDVSNLLFIEKEGNKNLKTKLQVFQSSFREFQEHSDRKKTDLEAKLVQAQEKERECRIFHTKIQPSPDYVGRNNSKININDIDDSQRLQIAEDEINNIKRDIESAQKDLNSKNNENQLLKENNNQLEKKMNDLNERNNKLKNEIKNLNHNITELKNTKTKLEKENKEIKTKYNLANNNLRSEKNKIKKFKENLNKKENEIIELKKQIEQLKQNNNFKNGMFHSNIGAKDTNNNNNNLEEIDVNIDEEMAQIEKKYKMINEQNKILETKNEEEKNKNN